MACLAHSLPKMHSPTTGFPHRLLNRNALFTASQSIIPLEELPQVDHTQNRSSENAEIAQRTLRSVDSGVAAWRLLAVAFVFEALLWGKDTTNHLISV
jgi:hypothetical protein